MKEQLLEIIELVSNRDTFILGVNLFKKKIDSSLYINYSIRENGKHGRFIVVNLKYSSLLVPVIKEIGELWEENDIYFFNSFFNTSMCFFSIYEKRNSL